jgi:glutamate-1-semialdehyde 2,1-aminomutase
MAVTTSDALQEAQRRYVERNPESRRLHLERAQVMPGGNTRSVIHVEPFPLTIVRGEGARITDADGHTYVDFLGEYTAGLYGHSQPQIRDAIRLALDDGLSFGAPNLYESRLAAMMCERFPSVELVRFCNSGTEANLLAMSLARVVTGREAIVVFAGGYHGGVFFFETAAGSPLNAPFPFRVGEYNDVDEALRLIDGDVAAVVVEPVQGSAGVIPGEEGFLSSLREAATEHGALLVFDEVMTSRLSTGGMQQVLGITPDLTTFGKYLGGGLAFGAFGGRADLMSRFDPSREHALPHAGTFNNAVLTMAAGAAGLELYDAQAVARVNGLGDRLRDRLNAIDAEISATGYGSLVGIHFTRAAVRRKSDSPKRPEQQALLHLHMLERGYSYARRGFVALSLPIEEGDVDGFADAVEELYSASSM